MTGPDRLGWILVGASYLLGSIPFGLLLARAFAGVDVRDAGSGNIGATNVARTAGRSLGILTLLLDAGKGSLAVAGTAIVLGTPNDGAWAATAGLFAFLGHVFPVWLLFRGGKGVATAFGVLLVLSPWLSLGAALVFAGVFARTRTVSLASMTASVAAAGVAGALHGWEWPVTRVAAVIGIVVLARHQSNVRRLLRGEESLFSARRSGSRSSRPPGG